jgi:hypothetical protein
MNAFPKIIVILSLAGAVAEAGEAPAPNLASAGGNDGIQFYLTFPKVAYTNGESVNISFVLTNLTDSPIRVPPAFFGVDLLLTVTNENNVLVPQKDDGHGHYVSGPRTITLPQHGCHTNSKTLDKYYNLTPGIYRFSAIRDMAFQAPWGKSVLSSAVVTITVTSPHDGRH